MRPTHPFRPATRLLLGTLLVGQIALTPAQTLAAPRQVSLTPTSDLRFGSFVVLGSGSRTVTSSGAVTSNSIISTQNGDTGPAQFTLSYDRGNNSKRTLDLVIEIVLSPPQPLNQPGITAQVSAFDSSIPGYPRIQPGQPIRIEMPNCRQRICSRNFSIGGRMDVTQNGGGGALEIPLLFDIAVISSK